MAAVATVIALGTCVLAGRWRYKRSFTCHFCNRYVGDRLPSTLTGSWYCPYDDCGQYNGFSSSGDYDRSLPEHSDPNYNFRYSRCHSRPFVTVPPVLCSQCQCEQALKIRALSRATTLSEKHAIEKRFKICTSCKVAVSDRLKRVAYRTRSYSTPLEISEMWNGRATKFSAVYLLILCADLIMIWQTVVPLYAILQLPFNIPFSDSSVLMLLAEYEYAIVLLKFALSLYWSRCVPPYCLMSLIDVFLTLSLHDYISHITPLPSLLNLCNPSDFICSYRFWAVIVRCIALLIVIIAIVIGFISKTPSVPRRSQERCSPFDPSLVQLPSRKDYQPQPHEKQSLLSPSKLNIRQDLILNDFSAFESSRSCAVEDLLAGISLSRSGDDASLLLSSSEFSESKPPRSQSYLPLASLFTLVFSSFILNANWSHWAASWIYTCSLLVLLVAGTYRPFTVPFTVLLLLKQCRSLSSISVAINNFIVKFGLDLVGLGLLGMIFFLDWSDLSQRFLNSIRKASNSYEA